jgi:hypothetical protein
MDREVALAVIAIAPQLLLLAVVVAAVFRYRSDISKVPSARATSVSGFGFRVELAASAVEQAVAARAGDRSPSANWAAADIETTSRQVAARAHRLADQLRGPGSCSG